MKVLAINSSPRKRGNTSFVVAKALEGAASRGAMVQRIDLPDMRIRPITEQDYEATFDSVMNDVSDDLSSIINVISASDAVIIASPVFFGSVTGQLKMMIDRFQFAWMEKNIRGRDIFPDRKKGAFISVQAQEREDFFRNSSAVVRHFFATLNISCDEELFLGGLESGHDALSRKDVLEKAFRLGERLAG